MRRWGKYCRNGEARLIGQREKVREKVTSKKLSNQRKRKRDFIDAIVYFCIRKIASCLVYVSHAHARACENR